MNFPEEVLLILTRNVSSTNTQGPLNFKARHFEYWNQIFFCTKQPSFLVKSIGLDHLHRRLHPCSADGDVTKTGQLENLTHTHTLSLSLSHTHTQAQAQAQAQAQTQTLSDSHTHTHSLSLPLLHAHTHICIDTRLFSYAYALFSFISAWTYAEN